VPTPLALWLVGLGITMHWNDPSCPQQNGVVERSMETFKNWSDPQTCASVAQWQERLDREERVYREEYPTAAGVSRWQCWPGLRHSGRRYSVAGEQRRWSLAAALEHLASYTLVRRVASNGRLSLFDRPYYVGVAWARKVVQVYLDPQRVEWVVMEGHAAAQVRTFPAVTLTRKNIVELLTL